MNSQQELSYGLMYHLVVVRPEPPGQFTAQPLGVPEIRVVAPTEKEAIEQAQRALAAWVGSLHWVPVPVPPSKGQSLLQWAGHAKNDPDFAAYLEEIQRFRQGVDDRECCDGQRRATHLVVQLSPDPEA